MYLDKIPLSIPSIMEIDIDNIVESIKTGNLVFGEKCIKLENCFSEYFRSHHAIMVSNGTAALHLSLLALGIGPGDEVIVPAYSFIATANSVQLTGAKPIFADTTFQQLNISPQSILQLITEKTKAVIVVHEFGFSADVKAIIEIAERFNLHVIEDAACALGSESDDGKLGTFGTTGCFSFHPRKLITGGEGGLVITKDKKIAQFISSMRNHGLDLNSEERSYNLAGFNYRMTDISATLIQSQFNRISTIIKNRELIAEMYFKRIKNKDVSYPEFLAQKIVNWQTFPILLENKKQADAFISYMETNRISCIRPAQLIPREPVYQREQPIELSLIPNATSLWERCVAIPLYEKISLEFLDRIVRVINEFK